MNFPSTPGEPTKYFQLEKDNSSIPRNDNTKQMDPTERGIQKKARQFLEGELPYIPIEVLLRLRHLRHISEEAFENYSTKMPNIPNPNKEDKDIIDTFHEKLKPYLEEFSEGNTFLKKDRLSSAS